MKQAEAARKIFRDLVRDGFYSTPDRHSGSEYSHKLVSNLFNRDKKMKAEVADLKAKLDSEEIKAFKQQMSHKLDKMFDEKVTERKRDIAAERRVDRRTPEEKAEDEKRWNDFCAEVEAYQRKKELENPTPPPAPTYGRRKCYRAKSKAS